jgi:hypothetical protein
MGELCRLTAIANDVHFNSREAAEEFMAIFEIGMVSSLAIQEQSKGWNVMGHITCLGSSENQKQGAHANISDSELCLANQLKKRDLKTNFTLQGACVREGMLEEIVGPVEHEGYTLDYKNTIVRDVKGREYKIPIGQLKILTLLTQTPKPYGQLFNEYNALSARPVGQDTFNAYIRNLKRRLGKDAIIRTPDNLISLSAKK